MSAFPTSTNANEDVLLALDSDRTGRDDVEISRGRGSLGTSCSPSVGIYDSAALPNSVANTIC